LSRAGTHDEEPQEPAHGFEVRDEKEGGIKLTDDEKHDISILPLLAEANQVLAEAKMEIGYWDDWWGFKLLKTVGKLKNGLDDPL
jgi:hypothetical protein